MNRPAAARRIGSKNLKKSGESRRSFSNNESKSGNSSFRSVNTVCQRDAPSWQKPISNFFVKAKTEEKENFEDINTETVEANVDNNMDES